MNAARVRRHPRKVDVALERDLFDVARRVEPLDRLQRNGREFDLTFGHLPQRWFETLLFPFLLHLVQTVGNDCGIFHRILRKSLNRTYRTYRTHRTPISPMSPIGPISPISTISQARHATSGGPGKRARRRRRPAATRPGRRPYDLCD